MAKAAVQKLAFSDEKKEYIIKELDPVLEVMVRDCLAKMPDQPIEFMADWLRAKIGMSDSEKPRLLSASARNAQLKREVESLKEMTDGTGDDEAAPANQKLEEKPEEDSEEEDDDDDEEEAPPPPPPKNYARKRASVSAEATGMWNQKQAFDPPKYPKMEEQTARLKQILVKSFLFANLDETNLNVILLAMKEMAFEPGQRIIQEGDDGDFLCLIEEGAPECKKVIDGEEKVVKVCKPGDVFGELALLYNAKRAASVDAADKCVAWQLDRETFNHIVKAAAMQKSELYQDFMKKVPLFSSLDDHMRAQIADCIKAESATKDQIIVKEGEQGDKFYLVEEGTLVALKNQDGGEPPKEVLTYAPGDYFGELAMLKDQPRAASVKVTSDTAKVLCMDRGSFNRLLGPLQEIMAKAADDTYK